MGAAGERRALGRALGRPCLQSPHRGQASGAAGGVTPSLLLTHASFPPLECGNGSAAGPCPTAAAGLEGGGLGVSTAEFPVEATFVGQGPATGKIKEARCLGPGWTSWQLRYPEAGSTPTQFVPRLGLIEDRRRQVEKLAALKADTTFPIRTAPSLWDSGVQNPFCSISPLRSLATLGPYQDLQMSFPGALCMATAACRSTLGQVLFLELHLFSLFFP